MNKKIKKTTSYSVLSKDKFELIANYTYDWESWISKQGKLLWINKAVYKLTGYSPEECLAMPEYPLSFVLEEDQPLVNSIMKNGMQESSGNDVPFRIRRKDDTIIWVSVSWNPMYDGDNKFVGFRTSVRDCTERKESEELSKENEKQFSSIVQNIPGAIYRCKTDGSDKMIFISNQFENITGFNIRKFKNKNKKEFVELIHQEDLQSSQKKVKDALANKQKFDIEYRLIAKNGKIKWVNERGQGIYDSDGKLEYQDGTFFDITEIKLAQLKLEESRQQLIESEEKSRLLLESANDGIFGVDNEGRTTFVNPMAIKLLGYKKEEIIGECIHILIHHSHEDGSEYPVEQCPMHKAFKLGETANVKDEVLWRKNGSFFHVEYTSTPLIKNNKNVGAVIVFKDISERKNAEREILLAKDTSDLIIEESPVPMFITSVSGEILKANKAALKFNKLSSFEELKNFNTTNSYVQPKKQDELRKRIITEKSVHNFELDFKIFGTGEIRKVLISGLLINYLNETSFLASLIDVTEIRKYEKELKFAKEQAEAANRAKSTFLANMSHELRTPMNAIIGYSEMLMEDAEDMEEPVFMSDLEKIRNAGKHLLNLINDVLDLSKVEAGKMSVITEEFRVTDLINDVKETISGLIKENGNIFEIEQVKDIETLSSDYMKLKQSLLNLLSNAGKFTQNGTVRLSVVKDNGNIVFSVSDTGIGIPEELIPHLFEEFTQVDDTTTREYEGTGLGLAITKRFCEMLNGQISVRSEKGKGSVFSIKIPIKSDLEKKRLGEIISQVEDDTSEQRPVLIIEDDENSANLIGKTLVKEGFRVITAYNGKEGIKLAKEHKPFAITLDVMMPEKDGWSVLRELKKDNTLKDIPVIMISVLDNFDLGYALGAKDYLIKPVNKKTLVKTIENCIPATNINMGPVLIVDDEPDARDLLTKILSKEGWYCQTAENGKQALELIEKNKPSLILLDIMMPVMDGFTFISELQKIDPDNKIPVIVITARDLSRKEFISLSKDTQHVIHKSAYNINDLIDQIKELVINIKTK